MDPRLKHNFSAIISGPSLSGKSSFVHLLLQLGEQMIDGAPEKILYCYGAYQPLFDQMKQELPHITFVEGLPGDIQEMLDPRYRNLLVIDDLMSELCSDKLMTRLLTKGRHNNLSVIFIVHNLFYQGKEMRTISLNASYFVIFKSPRGHSQIVNLAKQVFPSNNKFLMEAYKDATSRPFSYLFLDFRSSTPSEFRVRTNIFPGETQYAYVIREHKSK